ncbi:MAG: hypothetical protein IT456_05035 [Planctomycetes bacterium]|nr:hypothetical protein [Planctomycetota bacterium]
MNTLTIVSACAFFVDSAACQVVSSNLLSPLTNNMVYDSVRDRLIVPDGGFGITHEFDGTNWIQVVGLGGTPLMAFDEQREQVVAVGPGMTMEWDGQSWISINSAPPYARFDDLITYHRGRGRVISLSPDGVAPQPRLLQLYEWDGMAWTLIPSQSPLIITNNSPGQSDWTYHAMVYDEARDKVIVFGRSWHSSGTQSAAYATTWEWDPITGWVQYPDSGPLGATLWFDSHRGVPLRLSWSPPTAQILRWDPAVGWIAVNTLTNLPLIYAGTAYDRIRNRFYYGDSPTTMVYLSDANPALYVPHGDVCPSPGFPQIGLEQPWSRAWIGATLQVTAFSLLQSNAVLTMGFSDQISGATVLPLDLSGYGLTGCFLRVAPDATAFGVATNARATFQIPIPSSQSLVGTNFWQQVLAPVPGVNPAGLLMSASMRGSVGRAY